MGRKRDEKENGDVWNRERMDKKKEDDETGNLAGKSRETR